LKTEAEIIEHAKSLISEISLGRLMAVEIQARQRIIGDLGLDSLDYASLLLGCEEWLGIKVREESVDWSKITTVGELASFLHGQQDAQSST
jgi:acyl carrier protein